MTTVLVVDDQALIRQAVSDILLDQPGIEVLGQAVNGQEAVRLTRQWHPNVVLMDIRMPVLDGIEATAAICADPANAETRVLILTTFEEDEYVVSALRAGASGFLGKGAEPDEISHAIRSVHAGEALLSANATRTLISRYVTARPDRSSGAPAEATARGYPPMTGSATNVAGGTVQHRAESLISSLTIREREVLLLVARGLSNQDIATELTISPHTAKTHVNRIMTKVYAHDRAQLVILAYEGGLLLPGT